MTRKIKRLDLDLRLDPSKHLREVVGDNPAAWDAILEWGRLRLDVQQLIYLLQLTREERAAFERDLQGRLDFPREVRRARRSLKAAKSAIRFLKSFFGDLGEQFERHLENIINTLECSPFRLLTLGT